MKRLRNIARAKPPSFWWGVVAGCPGLLLVGVVVGFWLMTAMDWPRFSVEVVSNGGDVTRAGGVRVEILDERGGAIQTCNGACDDLLLEAASSDNSYRVRVLNADGECLACSTGVYVTSGLPSRIRVAGARSLDVSFGLENGAFESITIRGDATPP